MNQNREKWNVKYDWWIKDRIKKETLITNVKIQNLSNTQYRVFLGPFSNLNSLQKDFNGISTLEFENIEIIKND